MIIINLTGPSGNAFYILAVVRRWLIENSRSNEVDLFMAEATSGDYEHLLEVAKTFCDELEFWPA